MTTSTEQAPHVEKDIELTRIQIGNIWGFANCKGEIVVPCHYDYVDFFKEGFALFNSQKKWGYVNSAGSEIVSCKYDVAYPFENGIANVRSNCKWGVVDKFGNEFIKCKYDNLLVFKGDLAIAHLNGKYGFVNKVGKEIVKCKFEQLHDFSNGLACAKKSSGQNSSYGYINEDGIEVIPFIFEEAKKFQDGYAITKNDGKWGVINKTGQEIIPCFYDRILHFSKYVFSVQLNDLWGFINNKGVDITACKYIFLWAKQLTHPSISLDMSFIDFTIENDAPIYYKTFSEIHYRDEWEYIRELKNSNNPEILDLSKEEGILRHDGELTLVNSNSKSGYINELGEEVIPCIYDSLGTFRNGLAPVELNGKWGYLNRSGELIIQFQYDIASLFQEGMARVNKDEKWGYIDTNGYEVIDCKYLDANHFSDCLALVYDNGYKFIDKTGMCIIDNFSDADDFFNGLAPIQRHEKWGFINKSGKEIVPCIYEDIRLFEEGLACVQKNHLCGFVDLTGKEMIKCIYDNVTPFSNGTAYVKLNHKYGYIDSSGNMVTPFKYIHSALQNGINHISYHDGSEHKFGVFDTLELNIIPCKSKYLSASFEGMVKALHYRKLGFIDKYSVDTFSSLGFFDIALKSDEYAREVEIFNIEYIEDDDFKSANELKPEIEWINIPSGTFVMGSNEYEFDRSNDELAHEVKLSAFKMSKYLITLKQFDAYLKFCGNHNKFKNNALDRDRPKTGVSWDDAQNFAIWMGCRLPTEAEWEYACRAGTNYPFYTGSKLTVLQANFSCENWEETMPVGSYPPNGWGLFDMHGNVWEWCADVYQEYSNEPQIDPKGPLIGYGRVCRGGSFLDSAQYCRSASRNKFNQKFKSNKIGFRVVKND